MIVHADTVELMSRSERILVCLCTFVSIPVVVQRRRIAHHPRRHNQVQRASDTVAKCDSLFDNHSGGSERFVGHPAAVHHVIGEEPWPVFHDGNNGESCVYITKTGQLRLV